MSDFTRRSFLRLTGFSALGAAIGAPLLRGLARAGDARARACILLYMEGGPSQLDTFDPKPGTDNAAGVKAIGTSIAGVRFSEYLPNLAKQTKHLAVLRSLASTEGSHPRARHLMHTGYAPASGADHPSLGAYVAKQSPAADLPSYVAIGGPGKDAGFLGAQHAPFPVRNPLLRVRNIEPARGIDDERFDERMKLRAGLEDDFTDGRASAIADGQRAVTDKAIAMMRSEKLAAFHLDDEPASTKERYGEDEFGAGCLMARRLVESGVPFVEVALGGWDTHEDHSERIVPLTATLDRSMSALLADLDSRGLLDETLVLWTGDFGRTPWISGRGGRDHYPKVTPAVLAGGGVKGGQVIGATDKHGVEVTDGAVTVPDLFRTVAAALGLDPDHEYTTPAGRPITTVDGGTVVPGVF